MLTSHVDTVCQGNCQSSGWSLFNPQELAAHQPAAKARGAISFDYEYTEGVGHAIELARAAADDGYRYLVAVGGDGTVNEVANGILHSTEAGNTTLGVVSTGTGSDFARSAGIPPPASQCLLMPD